MRRWLLPFVTLLLAPGWLKPLFDTDAQQPERNRQRHIHDRWVWSVRYPVVRLSFGGGDFRQPGNLVNLFSQLNNLTDITLDPVYSSICGYTEDDLDTVFAQELAALNREQVRDWYNGYSWLAEEKVYNPFDILLLLRRGKFVAHWFRNRDTGVPDRHLFKRRVSSVSLDETMSTEELLSAFDVGDRYAAEHIGTEALLFQTGYLTIRSEENIGGETVYRMGYPNREVRQSLNRSLRERVLLLFRGVRVRDHGGREQQPWAPRHGGAQRRPRLPVRVQGGGDGAAGIGSGAVAGTRLRRQVPRSRRADPPDRRRVQSRHPQRDRIRRSRRLTPSRGARTHAYEVVILANRACRNRSAPRWAARNPGRVPVTAPKPALSQAPAFPSIGIRPVYPTEV